MGVRYFSKWWIIFVGILFGLSCVIILYYIAIKSYPIKYKEDIIYYSKQYNLDSALVFSVVKVESDFIENAISNKGAMGLMQITTSTANYIAILKGEDSFDMLNGRQNIEYGCFYLRYLLDKFPDTKTMLCAYNAGEGRVKAWLKDSKYSSNGQTIDYIEYAETREYVKKIEKTFKIYKKLYSNLLDKQ